MPSGRLFDGRTAQDRPVLLTVHDETLTLLDPIDGRLTAWPLAEIEHCDPDAPGPAMTLRRRGDPARLVVTDPGLIERLQAAGPAWRGPRAWNARHWAGLIAGLVASVGIAALLVDRLPSLLLPLVPHAVERRWSGAIETALAAGGRCDAPAGRQAIAGLLATLSRAAGIVPPPGFAVLDNDAVNAFTLPDGRVLILRGLIRHTVDPDEFAGVLAHELGHVRHRDPSREALRHLELSMLARSLGWSSGLGGQMAALSYGRRAEAAADASAVVTLRRAGLRADGLRRLLGSFGDMADGSPAFGFLADHPSNAARVAALPADKTGAPALSAGAWRDVKAICHQP